MNIFFFFFSKVGKMHFPYIWVFLEHAFGFKEIDFQDKKCKFGSLWKNALAASVVNFLVKKSRVLM